LSGEAHDRPPRLGVRVARNAALTFGAGCIAAIAQAAGSIAAARILGPHAYGSLGLLLWLASVASLAGTLGLPLTVTRALAEARASADSARPAAVLRRSLRAVAAASTIVAVLGVALAPLAGTWFRDPDVVAPARVAAVAVPALSLAILLRAALAGLDRYPALTRAATWLAPAQLALLVLGCASGYGAAGALAGFAAAQIVGVCLFASALPRSGETRPQPVALGPSVRRFAGIVVAIGFLDAIVWQRSELFFLGRFGPHEELARYSVAFGLSSAVMALVPGAFAAVLLPLFAEAAGSDDGQARAGRLWSASVRTLALVALPLAAGGAALAGPLVRILFGQPYEQAATPLAIVICGAAAGAVGSAGSSLLYGSGRHAAILVTSLGAATLNVSLDLMLIPRGGAIGAAVANSLSQVVAVCAGIAWIRRTSARSAPFPIGAVARIAAAAALMALPLAVAAPAIRHPLALLVAVAGGALVYAALLVFMRVLDSADIDLARRIGERLPSGKGLRWFGACLDALERAVNRGGSSGRP
jgi:O-antigen/teichoic acid export membrane protein